MEIIKDDNIKTERKYYTFYSEVRKLENLYYKILLHCKIQPSEVSNRKYPQKYVTDTFRRILYGP